MKRLAFIVGMVLALGVLTSIAPAEQGRHPGKGTGIPWNQGRMVSHGHFGHRFGGGPSNISVLYGSSGYGFSPGYGYGSGFGYGYGYPPYPYSSAYYGTYSYLGPLFVPGEAVFGTNPFERKMGFPPYFAPASIPNIIVMPRAGYSNGVGPVQPAAAFQPDPPDDPPSERGTNAESVALARRIIAVGDDYFQNQKFASAYQRYTSATNVAPRLADGYARQGMSLIALGRYDQAVRVIKRAIESEPGLSQWDFRLDTLYGPNRMAKQAHLDVLAKVAADRSGDPDLLFLLGFLLHFDGQTDRAKPFFQRAAQLAGNNQDYLAGFLN